MNVKWFLFAMAAVWCVCGVSQAGSIQVIPTQDATLESQAPDGPGGGAAASTAWNNGRGGIWRAMEQYDLSGFAGSTITAATYTAELKGITEPFSEVNFHPVTQAWSEEDPLVTWANYADKFDANVLHTDGPLPEGEFTLPGDPWIVLDIDPAIFQNWIDNPVSNLGWMIKLTPELEEVEDNKGWEWWSKDADEADGPAPFLTLVGDIVTGGPACDFDNSNTCDDADIDLLAAAVRNGTSDPKFNVDGIGGDVPDDADFDFYITDDSMLSTGLGDHDLNFMVNFNDFVKISNDFGVSGTGWDRGNGNTDDVTNFNDFVRMSNNFGMNFASGSNVPEPMGAVLLGLGGLALVWRKR